MGNKIELAFWNGDMEKLRVYINNMTWRQMYMQHYHRPGVFGAYVQHILVFRKHNNMPLYWNLSYHLNWLNDFFYATFSEGITAFDLAMAAGEDDITSSSTLLLESLVIDKDVFRMEGKAELLYTDLGLSEPFYTRCSLFLEYKSKQLLPLPTAVNSPLYPGAPEHLTPLYFAVIANNVGVLKELLARGAWAYPHPRASEGNYSLLHVAARMDHASMIPLLVQAGCCVNEDAYPNSAQFRTPFVVAAHYGNLRSLKVLVETPSFVLTPEQGFRSLTSAAQNGQFHVLSTLMKLCCRLLGNPSLFLYETHFQSSRLIEGDEDTDHEAVSVFHGAAFSNQHGALRTLIRCYKQFIGGDFPSIGISLMNHAVLAGAADTVAVLFEEGLVDLSSEDPCGPNNPLRTAVHHLEMGVLRVLMSSRCASFIPVSFSKGLLHYALALRAIQMKTILSSQDSIQQHVTLSFVAGLICVGCSIRSVDGDNGLLPIHEASMHNDSKAVQLLIDYGCPPNAFMQSSNGYRLSPMHIAAECDSLDVIEVLVANGCSVDFHHPLEDTPLHIAIAHGSLNAVETLLRLGASTSSRANRNSWLSPVHIAIMANQLAAIDQLVKYGANLAEIKMRTDFEPTTVSERFALEYAVSRILVEGGACIDSNTLELVPQSVSGRIMLSRVKHLVPLSIDCEPLLFVLQVYQSLHTSSNQRVATIKKLVDCGADVNQQYIHVRNSPLGTACKYGLYEEAQCLIDLGADVEARTGSGYCPIHFAITSTINHFEVVKLLLDRGCSANQPVVYFGEPDLTPFQLACKFCRPYIVRMLAPKVNDINQFSTAQFSPLHLALVQLLVCNLVTYNSDPKNVKDIAYYAPVRFPLDQIRETVETLLDLQCDVNAQDSKGVTPLDYAINYHFKKVVFLLTKASALKGTKITDREELTRHIKSVEQRLAGASAKFDVVETNLQAMTESYSRPESKSHKLDIATHVVESTLRNIYTDFIKHAEARKMASTLKKQGLIPASVEAKIKEATDVPTSNGHLYDHLFTQATPSTLDILCRVLKAQVGRPATSQLGGRIHAELSKLQPLHQRSLPKHSGMS